MVDWGDETSLGRIQEAADAIRGEVVETPTLYSRTLSEIVSADVVLKFENLQFTGSFKDRGALVKAALLRHGERFAGRRVGIVLSGGNIDSIVIARVIERDLVRTGRLVRVRIALPDRPSSLAEVTAIVAREGANIVEVWHQRTFTRLALESAEVDLMLETRGMPHAQEIRQQLAEAGYPARFLDLPE